MKRALPSRTVLVVAAVLLSAAAGLALVFVPTETKQGVDYVVTSYKIPAYEKALDFVQRDIKYGALAARITAGRRTPLERLLAVYDWTRENIRDTPEGFPIVDDHVWHIIVRGYGMDDQKADVFTTLATYAGVRAFWTILRPADRCAFLPVSFALVDGRWIVVDVVNGLIFPGARGLPASADEIAATPSIVSTAAPDLRYRGVPYAHYFANLCPAKVPQTLRAEKQMLGARLLFEARALVGLDDRKRSPDLPLCSGAPDPCRRHPALAATR